MRNRFWKKLDDDDRNFMWFYKKYLKGNTKLHYNTLYQQAKGDILTKMSDELKDAIDNFLAE